MLVNVAVGNAWRNLLPLNFVQLAGRDYSVAAVHGLEQKPLGFFVVDWLLNQPISSSKESYQQGAFRRSSAPGSALMHFSNVALSTSRQDIIIGRR